MNTNTDLITDLKPARVWELFAELTQIPRPSGKEIGVRNWIKQFADNLGFSYKEDEVGNLVVYKPAQHSSVSKKLMLQAHMDMVCESDPDVKINFDTDPIQLRRDGDYLYAQNTTLGSDNGIGLCTILAILEDQNIAHPAIEALFTIDEENGMQGIMELDPTMISADYMLNLDTEEEGSVYIGCAGSRDVVMTIPFEYSGTEKLYKLEVSGLQGGHSGVNIHENRINSIKLLGQLLFKVALKYEICISNIVGGNKRNAIPRNAAVTFAIRDEQALELITQKITKYEDNYRKIEPNIKITLSEAGEGKVFFADDTKYIIHLINALPAGVIQMSTAVSGLVQTSNNLGVITTRDNTVEITTMHRSSDLFELDVVTKQILSCVVPSHTTIAKDIFDMGEHKLVFGTDDGDMTIELSRVAIPWKPEPESKLLQLFQKTHTELFKTPAEVKAVHAGVECGFIRKYLPHCEIISFGPQIEGAHSPTEHIKISSVESFYQLTVKVIEELAQKDI